MSDKRSTAWSVTINNPVGADEESISLARQKGWKIEGQLEKGAEGTPHYQLLVKTPQVRFSALKKAFPRAHIEVARNIAALEQYVTKEETREGALKQEDELYPSLQKLWDLFTNWLDTDWLDNHHKTKGKFINLSPEEWLNVFDNFIREMITKGYVVETIAVNPQIRSIVKSYGNAVVQRSRNRIIQNGMSVDRQTDRQTKQEDEVSEKLPTVTNITDASWKEEVRSKDQKDEDSETIGTCP